jgi:hypothetical protein
VTENETNLRDLAAMFAMCGLIMRGQNATNEYLMDMAYDYAEDFMKIRTNRIENPDQGIATLKPKRKYERKTTD